MFDRRSFLAQMLLLPAVSFVAAQAAARSLQEDVDALKPLQPPEPHNDALAVANSDVDAAWADTDLPDEPCSPRVRAAVDRVMRGRKWPGSRTYRLRLECRAREHEAMYLPAERDWRMAELWADGNPRVRMKVL